MADKVDKSAASASKAKSASAISAGKRLSSRMAKDTVISSDKLIAKTDDKTKQKVSPSTSKKHDDEMLNILRAVKASQDKMEERLVALEEPGELDYYDENYEYDDDEVVEPQNKRQRVDECESPSCESNNSRFASLSKRFKAVEPVCAGVDSILADTVTDLFRKGMDDDQYEQLVRDEITPRPDNCDGLVTVKTNKFVWDFMSSTARSNDKKLQNCATSVVKAGVVVTNMVNKVAAIEKSLDDAGHGDLVDWSTVFDGCNDTLALLGHANRQINLTRRDFIKPELDSVYVPLCSHSEPYTTELFGDDVAKRAKEIEDSHKMGNKIQKGLSRAVFSSYRGRPSRRGRGRWFRGSRGRGGASRGDYHGSSSGYYENRKNSQSRGPPQRGAYPRH